MIPRLGASVRLKSNPRAGLLTVVSIYLEGEETWVALQAGDAKSSSKGARIHRPATDLEVAP